MITQQGEAGMNACAEKNESENPGWAETAIGRIAELSRARIMRGSFTIEELRAELRVDPPTDNRAWGAITSRAIKSQLIEPTGEYRSARSSHGSPKPCYRFCPMMAG